MSLRSPMLLAAALLPFVVTQAAADDDDNPWKPTGESLDELVQDGYSIIDTNVVVPPSGAGVTVEVIYLQSEDRVYRCLTRHVEGSEGARHRCDRLKR